MTTLRLRHFVWIAAILACPSTTPASARRPTCRSGFQVAAPAIAMGSGNSQRADLTTTGDACTFDVRLCANVGAPLCTARPLVRLSSSRAARTIAAPSTLDEPGACGAWTSIRLPVHPDRATRRRLRASAYDAAGRLRRTWLTLRCTADTNHTEPPPPTGDTRVCEGMTERSVGRIVDFPPSIPTSSCLRDEPSSNYLTPAEQLDPNAPEELHVISVYEGALPNDASRGFDEHPEGTIDVTVRARPKPIALYLGSYEPERWQLHLEPGAVVSRVLTFGYYDQTVAGLPDGVPVTALSYDDGVSCMYGWELEASAGGCPFRSTMLRLRQMTQLVETSFQGCYAGRSFVVPHSAEPPPPCPVTPQTGDEGIATRDVTFPDCEAVTQESRHCLTTAGGTVAVVGLDSGTVCTPTVAPVIELDTTSPTLAWRGEAVYACLYGAGLVRGSLRDGTVERGNMPCAGVAIDDAGRLLVSAPSGGPFAPPYGATSLYAFDSWSDALAGRPAEVYPGTAFAVSDRVTVRDGVVYRAWHATDTIWRSDIATGVALPDLHLQHYDGWILGLSATGDGRLVIVGEPWGAALHVFDSATGRQEGSVQTSTPVAGVACVDARR